MVPFSLIKRCTTHSDLLFIHVRPKYMHIAKSMYCIGNILELEKKMSSVIEPATQD